jgi:hypothetical protein
MTFNEYVVKLTRTEVSELERVLIAKLSDFSGIPEKEFKLSSWLESVYDPKQENPVYRFGVKASVSPSSYNVKRVSH